MVRLPFPGSLRGRFVLLMNLFVCALAAPLVFALPARIDTLSRRWAESRSVGIARLLAAATEAALDFDDPEGAEVLLDKLGATRGTVWAALLRADGTRLARWHHPPLALAPCPGGREQIEYEAGLMKVRVPVAGRGGNLGTLALAFDLAELEASLRETRRWITSGAILALLVGLLGAVAIGTFVARPLHRMTRVAERIRAGDLSASKDLETGRRGEAGALARAFESMLARLREEQDALATANAELTEKLAELKQAQEQLVAADRRINVGRLAASVAHEVNNPLAYVSSNLRYVAQRLAPMAAALRSFDPAAQRHDARSLGEMEKALAQASQGTERIRHIVKGLKTFSRGDEDQRERLELRAPIEAAVAMAGHEVVQRARLVQDHRDCPPVLASEVRLTQVFLNLLINAAQATPEGASDLHTIHVSTRTGTRGWAVAEVKDSGCGIPPENIEKLFSSFFTTKPVGVGTGLGLSISQGIVQALGGRIEVESAPGRGSTFRVLLPPAAEAPAAAAELPEDGRRAAPTKVAT